MHPRIELDDSAPGAPAKTAVEYQSSPRPTRHLADPDWERCTADALLLYVAEEPRVGLEFSYHGLTWKVVDYRDGWVATLAFD